MSVVHFEIPADNIERAKKFYEETFRWKITKVPNMDYDTMETGEMDNRNMPKRPGFINGGMMKRTDKIRYPVITIGVDSMDSAIEAVKKNGGQVVVGKQEIPGVGFSAYVLDTENNTIGLFQEKRVPQDK